MIIFIIGQSLIFNGISSYKDLSFNIGIFNSVSLQSKKSNFNFLKRKLDKIFHILHVLDKKNNFFNEKEL